LDFQILKSVKRTSDTSVYFTLLSSQSLHVCELLLSQASQTYKCTHIKEITLSIKLYRENTKLIELPPANVMEQKQSTLIILDKTYNQLLVVVVDVSEADYLGRDIMLIQPTNYRA
jgi:hypothetical protein